LDSWNEKQKNEQKKEKEEADEAAVRQVDSESKQGASGSLKGKRGKQGRQGGLKSYALTGQGQVKKTRVGRKKRGFGENHKKEEQRERTFEPTEGSEARIK